MQMCTRSLSFDPENLEIPLVKLRFNQSIKVEQVSGEQVAQYFTALPPPSQLMSQMKSQQNNFLSLKAKNSFHNQPKAMNDDSKQLSESKKGV